MLRFNPCRFYSSSSFLTTRAAGAATSSVSFRGSVGSRGMFKTSSLFYAQVVPYLLADIGEGILQVEVKEWFVKPGDQVKQFQPLCEVQSDKATTPISSRYDGIIRKLYVETNDIAYVGSPIVDIETDAVIAPNAGAKAKSTTPTSTTPTAKKTTDSSAAAYVFHGGKALAPPSVRRIAAENKVDLANVPATGKGGRVITKTDILEYIEHMFTFSGGGHKATSPSPSSSSSSTAAAAPSSTTAASTSSGFSFTAPAAAAEDKSIKIHGVQRIMVQAMTKANAIPDFGCSDEIEISNLTKARDSLRDPFGKKFKSQFPDKNKNKSLKLSFMPFFLKAASLALLEYPGVNAHTNDDCTVLTIKGSHNIGIAMDTDQGLIVPVIRDCQAKSMYEIALDIYDLVERGSTNKLTTSDLQGATFTLSNIGSIGATYTKPVINPPQVAIGALGRGRTLPRFDSKGNVYPAQIVEVSWSADHRVVDGATMVRFSNKFKEYLENPVAMVGYMR